MLQQAVREKTWRASSHETMNRPKTTSPMVVKPRYFRHLASWAGSVGFQQFRRTYRQEQVNHIHQDHDQVGDPGRVIRVRRRDERDGDKVVSQHLPVILAAVFYVDD